MELVAELDQAGRAQGFDRGRVRETDVPIAVEVLLEGSLEALQRGGRCRHRTERDIGTVAGGVGIPNYVLIGSAILPGNLVAGCRLLGADRCPGPELAVGDGGTPILEN